MGFTSASIHLFLVKLCTCAKKSCGCRGSARNSKTELLIAHHTIRALWSTREFLYLIFKNDGIKCN